MKSVSSSGQNEHIQCGEMKLSAAEKAPATAKLRKIYPLDQVMIKLLHHTNIVILTGGKQTLPHDWER